jgi:hypothetical protein
MPNAIKIVAIISMIVNFAGILYSAKNRIELMDNILPENKWLYINTFIISGNNHLTDDGEMLKNGAVYGFIIFLIGMLLFLVPGAPDY